MDSYILQELIRYGIINEKELEEKLVMSKRQEHLRQHPYQIWYSEKNDRWYTYLPDPSRPGGRRMVKRKNRDDVEQAVFDFYEEMKHRKTVRMIFYAWLKEKQYNVESQTILKYENVFKRFIESTDFADRDIRSLSFQDLDHFCRTTIGKDEITADIWSDIRTDLFGIIRYAKKTGLTHLSVNDFKDIDIPKSAFKKKRLLPGEDVFTRKEAKKLISYIDEHDDDIVLLGIRLVFKTGLRIGELSALKYTDFDFGKGVLTVTRTEVTTGNPNGAKPKTVTVVRDYTKGAKGWRQIIIDQETCELLQKIHSLNPLGEYLFEKNGKRVHSSAWSYKLPRVCKELHIGTPSERGRYSLGKSMHKGRKNYASTLLHSGVDPKLVQEQMGHQDLKTTINYYDRDIEGFEAMRKALLPVLAKL